MVRPPPLVSGEPVVRCRPIPLLYRPSLLIWEVGCFRHKAQCHCIRMANWWGLLVVVVPPLKRTKSVRRPGRPSSDYILLPSRDSIAKIATM